MLTAGDVLAKTLAKSQKITFWSQKNGFGYFFFCSLLWMLLGPWELFVHSGSTSYVDFVDFLLISHLYG